MMQGRAKHQAVVVVKTCQHLLIANRRELCTASGTEELSKSQKKRRKREIKEEKVCFMFASPSFLLKIVQIVITDINIGGNSEQRWQWTL